MFEIASFILKIHKRPNIAVSNFKNGSSLLKQPCLQNMVILPSRTTLIVKRKIPVNLYKEGNRPRLLKENYKYILEENTESNPIPMMDIVLTSYVPGVGNPGDIVSMKRNKAYNDYILPGFADYPTPENLEYSKKMKADEMVQKEQITPSVEVTLQYLRHRCFSIVMNKETEWTIEPWHIRASFRKAGVQILSDSSIELPKQQIKGPNLELEGKEFPVTITINKYHKVKARCKIHHWSTNIEDRLPYEENHWLNSNGKVLSEEDSKQTTDSETSKIS